MGGPSQSKSNPPDGTVYLVDDDPSVLRAIGRLVRSAGWDVATFDSPLDFLEKSKRDATGCLVLDLNMPGMNGLELQEKLTDLGYHLAIVFLTGTGDIPTSVRAMKSGAVDFLSKPCSDDELLAAIRVALAKERKERATRRERQSALDRFGTLTPREHEVMLGVIAGLMNKEIAADLGSAEKTVKVHRGRVMKKMNVQSVAELVRLAERAGVSPNK